MTSLTVELKVLHPAQQEIANHPARFKVVCCGRRFGKTDLSVDLLVNDALDGYPTAYFAPSYGMVSNIVWPQLKKITRPIREAKNEVDKRLELITGGSFKMWTMASPDSSLGGAYKRIVVDEAAVQPDLMNIFNQVMRPMLVDYRGEVIFISTPRGHNDFWQLYNRGNDPAYPDWASFNYPTSANPYIHPGEIDDAERELPERTFEQEYLAKFIEDGGGVFRRVSAVTKLSPAQPYEGRFVFGVDWGKAVDFTVISVLDANTRKQVAIDRFNQISWPLQRGRLRAMYDLWKPVAIHAESNSIGEPNIEALQMEGLPVVPFQTTATTKGPLIDGLALAIERGDISLLDDPVQKTELQAYQMERLPSGKFRYNAPPGGHDDTVIALALAYQGIATSGSAILFDY